VVGLEKELHELKVPDRGGELQRGAVDSGGIGPPACRLRRISIRI
jgi:hypothetical protein